MTRQLALAKFLKKHGDDFSINEINHIKAALKWYGEDDIVDNDYEEHLIKILQMFEYINK